MENIPSQKSGRGEAWKFYQNQHKGCKRGERPKISNPIPIPSCPIQPPPTPARSPLRIIQHGFRRSPLQEVPRSRTYGVLSSISQSLSRASLSRATNRSRNVSGSSGGPTPVPKQPRSLISRFSRKTLDPTLETELEQESLADDEPALLDSTPDDPRYVSKSMPFPYWTGRFTALYDRLEGELLESRNLTIIMEGLSARSALSQKPNTTNITSSATTMNNPSTSVYAAPRPPRRSLGCYQSTAPRTSDEPPSKSCIRIHHSATSNAVLETVRKPLLPQSQPPTTFHPYPSQNITRTAPSSRLPSYDQAIASTYALPLALATASMANTIYESDDETAIPTQIARELAIANADALTDEISRRRRVLIQLESFCLTDEARYSLYKWQQVFARRERCEVLMPPRWWVETVEGRPSGKGGLVGRLEGLLHHGRQHGEEGRSLSVGRKAGQSQGGLLPLIPVYPSSQIPRVSHDGGVRRGGLRGSVTGPKVGPRKLRKEMTMF